MIDTVIVAFPRFSREAERIAAFLGVDFREYKTGIFTELFPETKRIIALMSMGIAVRSIAPLLRDKWTDPAVVVVSPDLRYAVPLVGGHHGANALARELSPLGIQPVITTATETAGQDAVETVAMQNGCEIVNRNSTRTVNAAVLDGTAKIYAVPGPAMVLAGPDVSILVKQGEYAVGVGCRKGVAPAEVSRAIRSALDEAGVSLNDVMVVATTVKKSLENGLIAGVAALPANLVFLDDDTINAQAVATPSRAHRIGLLGVAEPCALAVAKRKELVMRKKVFGRVTVAIAR
jgi:cobalt-precorrin 5A hydrolase